MENINNQIGKKLFKKIFGWYVLVAILLTVFQVFSEYKNAKEQLVHELEYLSTAFYDALDNSIWNLDEDQIKANVEAITALDSVRGLLILDVDNNILAKSGDILDSNQNNNSLIVYKFNLIHSEAQEKEKIASIEIQSSTSVVFSRLEESVWMIIIIAIIKSTILFTIFLFFTKKVLSIPLKKLLVAVKNIEPSHYEAIQSSSQNDELSNLTLEYNKMGSRLTTLFTKTLQIKDELADEHKYLQAIINSSDNPIMLIRNDYVIKLMNHKAYQGLDRYNIADKNSLKCYELLYNRSTPCTGLEYPCPLEKVQISRQKTVIIHEKILNDGKTQYNEITSTPLFDENKECIGIIKSSLDITQTKKVEKELKEHKEILDYKTNYDALTNLPNRDLLNKILEKSVIESRLSMDNFAVLFIDLDRFKQINDSFGHKTGDIVLKAVTQRLKAKVTNKELLARIGGDEFVIVEQKFTDLNTISTLAQNIIDVLRQPIHVDGHTLYITCSIGISTYPKDNRDAYTLLKYADTAMYKAKNEGRNNFQYYLSNMTERVYEQIQLEANLRRAIANKEFILHYQPQIDAVTSKLKGAEALVRWLDPEHGLIPPYKFIDLAQETGLIIDIDTIVMREGIRQFSLWREAGLDVGILSLNLAAKHLESDEYLSVLQSTLKEFNFKPQYLNLEVTEGDIMRRPQESIIKLKEINDFGVKIAIDDFGTGYSSLAYLKKLPISKLKIDKSFIDDTPQSKDDVAIVKTIIALADNLGIDIIAEGVESKAQKEFLIKNGCNDIQGYYFSKALSADDFGSYVVNL